MEERGSGVRARIHYTLSSKPDWAQEILSQKTETEIKYEKYNRNQNVWFPL